MMNEVFVQKKQEQKKAAGVMNRRYMDRWVRWVN